MNVNIYRLIYLIADSDSEERKTFSKHVNLVVVLIQCEVEVEYEFFDLNEVDTWLILYEFYWGDDEGYDIRWSH